MKTKILTAGFLLIALMIAGIGGVSAGFIDVEDTYSDDTCETPKYEFFPDEIIYAKVDCSTSLCEDGYGCQVWVCPCDFDETQSHTQAELGAAGCSFTSWADDGTELGCIGVTIASEEDICSCFDIIIFDTAGGGGAGTYFGDAGGKEKCGGYDAVGVTCNDCEPTTSAAFHVAPEASTLILIGSGLFALYGYARVKKKK